VAEPDQAPPPPPSEPNEQEKNDPKLLAMAAAQKLNAMLASKGPGKVFTEYVQYCFNCNNSLLPQPLEQRKRKMGL